MIIKFSSLKAFLLVDTGKATSRPSDGLNVPDAPRGHSCAPFWKCAFPKRCRIDRQMPRLLSDEFYYLFYKVFIKRQEDRHGAFWREMALFPPLSAPVHALQEHGYCNFLHKNISCLI
ncbi:MAG: hypothetical protein ACI4NA_07800 [Succinivibrio sp.]